MTIKRALIMVLAAFLVACGGTPEDSQKRQEYIDKCLIEAGPHADKNAFEYCAAKWRQSQREK